MMKFSGLAEDLLCQIKSMSTDDATADLLMSSQKNHQSYIQWTRRKYKKFDLAYWDIPNH